MSPQLRSVLDTIDLTGSLRNISIYAIGIAFFVIGTLGMSGAISLHVVVSAAAFALGILVVIAVHEYLGGPV